VTKPKTKKVVSDVKERRKRFAAAHEKGMRALRTHDYDALGEAIREERKLIEEQAVQVRAAAARTPRRKSAPGR
jgi:hypothetical protein